MKKLFQKIAQAITGRRASAPRPTQPRAISQVTWTAADSTLKMQTYTFTLIKSYRKGTNNKNTTAVTVENTAGYKGTYSLHELEIFAASEQARPRIRAISRAALQWLKEQHGMDVTF